MSERYLIGTVDGDGEFTADPLGNDPDCVSFSLLHHAIEEMHEIISHRAATDTPLTNAAVYDAELDRIVWRSGG
jgi:hypothetical protein